MKILNLKYLTRIEVEPEAKTDIKYDSFQNAYVMEGFNSPMFMSHSFKDSWIEKEGKIYIKPSVVLHFLKGDEEIIYEDTLGDAYDTANMIADKAKINFLRIEK